MGTVFGARSGTRVFGPTSTTEDVLAGINLQGKRILVTGVSAGLGVETARSLAAHGAQVVGAARDLKKAEARTALVRKESAAKGGSFEIVELDLANLKSVRDCADHLLERGEPFDVVIANAGVMATPFGRTADGFETQFGTNHLGHFVLINRIASLIRAGGRLINLSSAGHRFSNVDLEDPNLSGRPMSPSLRMGGPRRQTSSSQLPSTNGTGPVVCALRLYIREAFRPSWIDTWTRAMLERRSNR
jgi:short chain dehydrogenase